MPENPHNEADSDGMSYTHNGNGDSSNAYDAAREDATYPDDESVATDPDPETENEDAYKEEVGGGSYISEHLSRPVPNQLNAGANEEPRAMATRPRGGQSKWTEPEIEIALRTLAMNSGNLRATERQLAANDFPVPYSTLRRWAGELHATRYQEIKKRVVPELQAIIAERCEELALSATALESQMMRELVGKTDDMNGRDLSTALRNVSTTKGINVDKARIMRDQPTEIPSEDRSMREIVRGLERFGLVKVHRELLGDTIDAEKAEDVTDADVVDG